MGGPRVGLSALLILGAVVLVSAVQVGNHVGTHVLGQFARAQEGVPTPLLTPVPAPTDHKASVQWKRVQVISVATDPGFPDPRVTPIPPPPPPARTEQDDQVAAPPAAPTKKQSPATPQQGRYTSPPLPIPLATHEVNYPDY